MHKLTRKRQVTIPKSVCNQLGLEPGNMVEIFARDGVAHLVRMSDKSLAGRFSNLVGEKTIPPEKRYETGNQIQGKTEVQSPFHTRKS